jgi:NADPH:quinone reductase-like Zn-dependent oxidoreductase
MLIAEGAQGTGRYNPGLGSSRGWRGIGESLGIGERWRESLKAIVCTAYGPPEVLKLREVEKPAPKENEVLVRIHATTVTAGDTELRAFKFPYHTPLLMWLAVRMYTGLTRPTRMTILGQELAGEIEEVGSGVTRYAVGDQVFAGTGFGLGGYAEYKCLPENAVMALKPTGLGYGEAAAIGLAGVEAVRLLNKTNLQPGQRILINAAGGSIGTFAVQLAKHFGGEVTAVDSTGKLQKLRDIGADHVVDYTREDFTKSGETYDVILDVASKSTHASIKPALKPNGTYVVDTVSLREIFRSAWVLSTKKQEATRAFTTSRAGSLVLLKELVEAGKIKPVIDRTFPLEQMVEAHRYVATGRKVGNIAITVGHDGQPAG